MSINYTVSVRLMTFNHAPFIREAIESILMQKTNFFVEVVVGDDFSTDGTLDIIREYRSTENIHIRILERKEGDIYHQERQKLGRIYNFQNILDNCTGKYIALLDGDDYWTDPLKLQKQVDFLEQNSLFSSSAHQSFIKYEDYSNRISKKFAENVGSELTIHDFLGHRKFHTASIVFRAYIIRKHSLPFNIVSADRALILLLSSYGKFKYFEEEMCCYRKNTGGISSQVSAKMIAKDLNILKWIMEINPAFPRRQYAHFIYRTVLFYPPSISPIEVFKYSFHFIASSFFNFPYNLRNITLFLWYQLPSLVKKSFKK